MIVAQPKTGKTFYYKILQMQLPIIILKSFNYFIN